MVIITRPADLILTIHVLMLLYRRHIHAHTYAHVHMHYICTQPPILPLLHTCSSTHMHHTYTHTASPAPYRENAFFFSDMFINLTIGDNQVVGRSVVINGANSGVCVCMYAMLYACIYLCEVWHVYIQGLMCCMQA